MAAFDLRYQTSKYVNCAAQYGVPPQSHVAWTRSWTSAATTLLLVLFGLLSAAPALIAAENAKYSMNLTGIAAGTAYTLSVKIGTATTGQINTFRLIADTGSSNDAILGEDCCGDDADVTFSCSASPTCIDAGDKVSIAFAGANIIGHFATDQWASSEIDTLTKKFLVIDQQDTFYRSEYDGITGLAYKALAQPTSSPPTSFYEDLVTLGKTKDAFGMLLCGIMQPLLGQSSSSNISLHAGQLVVGGSEGTKGESYYSGTMMYSPIAREAWYVVMVSDIGFNGKSLGLSCAKYNDPQAIVDSGTSNLSFPSEIYNALMDQIRAATLSAIPDFDANYFDSSKSCCGQDYCDPRISSADILKLPSIYITIALQNDGSTDTNKHFTVEIPPEYYWRPEMNGANSDTPCRAIGISEGSAIVLGDVFMDGLYAYHDREDGKIGLAVASNCPNGVKSTKKVYVAKKTDDWCSCFSSTMKEKSSLAKRVPWGSGCFFWIWWMYIVLAAVIVFLLAIGVLVYWYITDQKMKRMKAMARADDGSEAPTRFGSSGVGASMLPSTTSSPPSAPVAPAASVAPVSNAAAIPSNQHLNVEKHQPEVVLETHYTKLASPHSVASDGSSIALLSSPSMSSPSSRSVSRKSSSSVHRGKSFGGGLSL
uniref:Peptidase A1 domain-containing protein n=1 Tax=Globisporangium ultimum (strain ATCC 200006 / CBS 805.95 / DAOM BR144) TaxID=431595 RepID=K3WZE8_GLOUD